MMAEQSMDTEQGTLYYTVKEERITITMYQGTDTTLRIPEQIDGLGVRKIGKKAFMGSRQLQCVVLPDTVKKIGDWAFAYCPHLTEVTLPRRRISMGKGVFLEDKKLERLHLRTRKKEMTGQEMFSEKDREDIAVLLAAVNQMPDAEYLLDCKEAGTAEWIAKWDARLIRTMEEADEKGYTQMILCGEEDINCNLDNYVKSRRKRKVRLCFLRLLHPYGIKEPVKQQAKAYLLTHSVGQPSMETWLVLKEEKGHIRQYYELYAQLGCINSENYDATLADLGERHPEMKAYFMRENGKQQEGKDFFASFSL